MERIARDSDKDNWPILEILTAYVRGNSPRVDQGDSNASQRRPKRESPRSDIAAILTVLGRRDFDCENQLRLFSLRRTDLRAAELAGGNLCEIDFGDSLLQLADLAGAQLQLARFVHSDLAGANFAFANCSGTNFERAVLRKADLIGANLSNAIASDADMSEAMLAQANAQNGVFIRTDLRKANLLGTKFRQSNLSEANLSRDLLFQTDFAGAKLESANFRDADVSIAVGLTQSQIDSAFGNERTKLPTGISRPSRWGRDATRGTIEKRDR